MSESNVPVAEGSDVHGVSAGDRLAAEAALRIATGFATYADEFASITKRSKWRFQTRDWKGRHEDALERLDLYDKVLREIAAAITGLLEDRLHDEDLWASVKERFHRLIRDRHDAELAETFFNSVTRRIFNTVGINRRIEFFRWYPRDTAAASDEPIFHRYEGGRDTRSVIRSVLQDYRFTVPYEDPDRDADLVAGEIDLYLWPLLGQTGEYRIEVIRSPFFRNKVAYLVGRIVAAGRVVPLVLPLYHGDAGVFVDTVLLAEAEVSKVFSFAFSYFHVLVERHDLLIEFLRSILPEKPLAELYISIGYNRHGKTEFYRDLHRFVHRSRERFVIAPGKEGAVMTVFTLPDYDYVLQGHQGQAVLPALRRGDGQDRAPAARCWTSTRSCARRDRVGPNWWTRRSSKTFASGGSVFDKQLLAEFRQAAQATVTIDDDHVVIRHAYVQRKVTPLPMFMVEETTRRPCGARSWTSGTS